YWFGPVKWLVVTTLVPVGLALVLRTRPLLVVRRPSLAACAFVAWLAVAAVFAVDPLYAWIGTPERHLGVAAWVLCLLALAAGQAFDAQDRVVLAAGVVVAGAGLGAVATAEAFGWEPDVLDVGSRLTATFGSAAYVGAASALLLPCCAGTALDRAVPRVLRVASTFAAALLVIATLGSGARAAWVGLAASAVVVGVARRDDFRRVLTDRGRAHVVASAVVA